MDLVIYTGATDLSAAAVTSTTDLTAVADFAALTYGDSEPLSLRFTTGAAGIAPAWVGVTGHVVDVSLGFLRTDGIALCAATSAFTYSAPAYAGTLYCGSEAFASYIRSTRAGSGYLTLQVRHTDTAGKTETLAALLVPVAGSVPAAGAVTDTPVDYATWQDVLDAQSAAEAAQAAAESAQNSAESAETAAASSASQASGHKDSAAISANAAANSANAAATSALSASTDSSTAADSAATATAAAGSATSSASSAYNDSVAAAQSAAQSAASAGAALASQVAAANSASAAAASAATAGSGNGQFSNTALTGVQSVTFQTSSAITAASGQLALAAAGTNQNITLTPSGSGIVTTSKRLTVTDSTASSSTSTGSAVLSGGLGVAGAGNFGGNVGVGGAAAAGVGLLVNPTGLTGTSQYGLNSSSTFTSAATTIGVAGYFRTLTANASFTLATSHALFIESPSRGAASAITTQNGLLINNQGAAGITNAYAIDIAAQSGAATANVGLRNAGTTLLTNATASTSTTSGSLVVSGGLGVAGSVYAGNIYYARRTGGDLGLDFRTTTSGTVAVTLTGYGSQTSVIAAANAGPYILLQNLDATANTYTSIGGNDASGSGVAKLAFVAVDDATNEGRMSFMTRPSGGSLTEWVSLTGAGTVSLLSTTEATTAGAGSLTTAGGIYAAKKVVSSGDFEAADIGEGFVVKSPNGTRWRITVSDAGAFVATSL